MNNPLEEIVSSYIARTEKLSGDFGTYDFETFDWTKPLCADAFDGAEHSYNINRESPTEVVRTLLFAMESSDKQVWWAHNGGKYDALFIVECIRQLRGWKCDGAVAAGRIIQLRIMSPNACFTLKDSYAVIQSSLEKALSSFEIPVTKVFTKQDYDRLDKPKTVEESLATGNANNWSMRDFSDDKLKRGCQADTTALHTLICKAEELFREWGGQLKSTFSASALSVVKAQLKKPLPSHDGNQWANDFGKAAYAGGRVEVFKHKPVGALHEIDLVSSYPWSMSQPLPWFLIGWDKPDLYATDKLQLIHAHVSVPYQYIPPLPYCPPKGGLYFPWGEWSGWFTSVELKYAIERCDVTARLNEAISYTVDRPFAGFIDRVFREKQQSTGARREFCKLVLNGCYGKFAQRPENTKLLVFDSAEAGLLWAREHSDKNIEPLNDSRTAWALKTFRWPKQTHYALASFVTGYSRIRWHEGAVRTHGLAYGDTDSIHCSDYDQIKHECGKGLGDWEAKPYQFNARFYAPKLYELHPTEIGIRSQYYREPKPGDRYPVSKFASKGFPVDAEAFARIVRGELVGNKNGRMQLLKTQLRKDTGAVHLTEQQTEKSWHGNSQKRYAIPNHPEGDTKPWHVRDLSEGLHIDHQSPLAPAALVRTKTRSGKQAR